MENHYQLLDSGEGEKLEKFGRFILSRPCSQAVWEKKLHPSLWSGADAHFTRTGAMKWVKPLPGPWECDISGLSFKLQTTDFGHVGVFPEHAPHFSWMEGLIRSQSKEVSVLNLFAYSGGATLACAKAGAKVCHLDSSKGMTAWAKENALLNGLNDAPIRWIIDDAMKFLAREERRGACYDAILLDPPTFGRGGKGEVFKIEEKIIPLLKSCQKVLKPDPLFILFTSHTPQFSPLVMKHLFHDAFGNQDVQTGELVIDGNRPLPLGTFARWGRC
jgi:23S rRNA (cytosine1962-C5)-methyltransferase